MSGLEILLFPIIGIVLAMPPAIQAIGHGIERAHQKLHQHHHKRIALRSEPPRSHSKLFSMELAQLWWKEVTAPKPPCKGKKELLIVKQSKIHAEPYRVHGAEKQTEKQSPLQASALSKSTSAILPSSLLRGRFLLFVSLLGAMCICLFFSHPQKTSPWDCNRELLCI